MRRPPTPPIAEIVSKLREELIAEPDSAKSKSSKEIKRLVLEISQAATELSKLARDLDAVKAPVVAFDPGNPRTIGFFVALALTAQPRVSLNAIQEFYGAGVYAIYYKGDYPLYQRLSRSETPIYVGQASTGNSNARTPLEQGVRLAARLNEHRKNIKLASSTLKISDFECRALVVQTGWETGAEDYLIRLFQPIWNNETRLVFGLGKHGDSAATRRNKRSPWDTLHPGRKWAASTELEDAKSEQQIEEELKAHFEKTPVYKTFEALLDDFRATLQQK